MKLRLLNTAAGFGLFILIFYILHIGRSLVLPLIIALVIWYLIMQFTKMFQRFSFGNAHLPYWICFSLSLIISVGIIYLFAWLITYSITNIVSDAPRYQDRLQMILNHINDWTGKHLNVSQLYNKINISQLFSRLALVISDTVSNITLILIYLLFLILEANTFDKKLESMCNTVGKYNRVKNILSRIQKDINSFFKVKVFMNALAGLISYLCLIAFGIDYAEFWGVFIFLLHFIPFIGPIIAVLFVLLAASIQIYTLFSFVSLALILILIQFAVGNLLEPKLMGDRLDLSPLVILLSLAFWGYIWGIIGMFLCIPIMVILAIILSNFPQTKGIAVALSAKGAKK